MTARPASLTLFRLWAALMLGLIGLQAAAPAAPSVGPTHGSAFSASTYEVALVVKRHERVQRQELAPQPLAPLHAVLETRAAAAPLWSDGPLPRPNSTGPPRFSLLSWKPAPRAPPSS